MGNFICIQNGVSLLSIASFDSELLVPILCRSFQEFLPAIPGRLVKVGFTQNPGSRPFATATYFRTAFSPQNAYLLPILIISTEAAEMVEGFCIAYLKSLGLSVNDRDEFPGSYSRRIELSSVKPGFIYINAVHDGIDLADFQRLHRENQLSLDNQADADRGHYESGRRYCRNSATGQHRSQINLGQGRMATNGCLSDNDYFSTILELIPGPELLELFIAKSPMALNNATRDIDELKAKLGYQDLIESRQDLYCLTLAWTRTRTF